MSDEARAYVLQHGPRGTQLLIDAICKALKEKDEVRALELDHLLSAVEQLIADRFD